MNPAFGAEPYETVAVNLNGFKVVCFRIISFSKIEVCKALLGNIKPR
jgi:hypothetical protein